MVPSIKWGIKRDIKKGKSRICSGSARACSGKSRTQSEKGENNLKILTASGRV